jgi:ABC-2 type transport system permease protein
MTMGAQIRSELRKVLATRLALGLLLGAVAIAVLALGVTLWGPTTPGMEAQGVPTSLATTDDVLALLGVTSVVAVFALVFGVTFATAEFRHQTAATTFLSEPRRWIVLVAKAVTAAVVGVVYALATLAVAMAMLLAYAQVESVSLPMGADVWTFLAMSVLAVAVNAVLGVGVGAALRSQVGAIVAVLVWLFVVESLVAGLVPSVARWTPFAAGNAMTVLDGDMGIGVATAVAVGYALAAIAAGTWLTERRDAT